MRGVPSPIGTLIANGSLKILALPNDWSPSDEFEISYKGIGGALGAITVNVFGTLDGDAANLPAAMMTSANVNDVLSIKAKFPYVHVVVTNLALGAASAVAFTARAR
jgi:hypothetical protein